MQAPDDVRGLPLDILQDIKHAQYQCKVAEMTAITRAERVLPVGSAPRPTPADPDRQTGESAQQGGTDV